MCNTPMCSTFSDGTYRQKMRISDDPVTSMTTFSTSNEFKYFKSHQQVFCHAMGNSNSDTEAGGELYYLNITRNPFQPYFFVEENGQAPPTNQAPVADPILTRDWDSLKASYTRDNPPYSTNNMACTSAYGNRPVCHNLASVTPVLQPAFICRNIGNPDCISLHGPGPT
ncbi:hypothetical protein DM02DRAFT_631863 [Periconia macrospinosa]|uniref:Uncharacterized protein n=1 Tax=Periconia macrospinosa TaxID=97972 RepID=A0A2V1DES3_9PLEO|nr:hypothetical protein DM02DRAFT_631863 [Periconia macrospinosa]